MNFNSKNISDFLILICFCFLTFYSCKKVTKKNQYEYYSGMTIDTGYFNSIINPTTWKYSFSSDLKIHHLGEKIGNKKDTLEVMFTDINGDRNYRILYFQSSNFDSIFYLGNSNSLLYGEQASLSNYKRSKKILFHYRKKDSISQRDIYFLGIQK